MAHEYEGNMVNEFDATPKPASLTLNDLLAGQCPDCNGKDLTWDYANGGSQFFLGCNTCSATVKVVTVDKITDFLNKLAPQS